jgi:tripartite-type tricarboxylate transporter receptor subunit TctC
MVSAASAINATLYHKLNFNFIRDIAPVAGIIRLPNVMEVNPSFLARSVPEFIAYAKANPGKVNMASGCSGTSQHLSGELFKILTGINMLHVPYRGDAPAIADLLGGQVQVMFGAMPVSIEHIRAGRLRALAVTTAARQEALLGIPTVGEFVAGYEASGWIGIGSPKNTPTEIVDKLNTRRSQDQDAARRSRRNDACAFVRRLRQAHRRRNREVGQGDPGGQPQGGITHPRYSTKPVPRIRLNHVRRQ